MNNSIKPADRLKIIVGDILDDDYLKLGEAIVLPTNPMMRCGAGVSGAIFKKAGIDVLEHYCETKYNLGYFNGETDNAMKPGEVRITPGFALPCDIVFVQGPKAYEYDDYNEALHLLLTSYQNVLDIADDKGYKSILMPALGTGSYCFEHEKTVGNVIDCILQFLKISDLIVYFVLIDEKAAEIYRKALIGSSYRFV